MTDEWNTNAGFLRSARSGRKNDALRLEILNLLHSQFVIAPYDHLGPQLTHVLHQVVGERIVVVENEDHARHSPHDKPGLQPSDLFRPPETQADGLGWDGGAPSVLVSLQPELSADG